MDRFFLVSASIMGFLAVALGAFGAHGLKTRLGDLPDFQQRMDWWQTAAHYHLAHAVAVALAAYLIERGAGAAATVAGYAFLLGVLLFSGSLYAMTLTGVRALGAVTPLGGLCLLVAWAALALSAYKLP